MKIDASTLRRLVDELEEGVAIRLAHHVERTFNPQAAGTTKPLWTDTPVTVITIEGHLK